MSSIARRRGTGLSRRVVVGVVVRRPETIEEVVETGGQVRLLEADVDDVVGPVEGVVAPLGELVVIFQLCNCGWPPVEVAEVANNREHSE